MGRKKGSKNKGQDNLPVQPQEVKEEVKNDAGTSAEAGNTA